MALLKTNKTLVGIAIAVAAVVMACNGVPDGVLGNEQMAQLMADMRMADAVVSVNSSDYRNPAAKLALRDAVFRRHGVSEDQFDSSLVWYGHNVGKYQEMTDRSIEILQDRLEKAGSAAVAAAMSVAGDSVDIWESARLYTFTKQSPTDFVTFHLTPDRNWEPGDVYTWHTRFVLSPENAMWAMTAEYDDGVTEFVQSNLVPGSSGRQELTFFTDSTRNAKSISGWLIVKSNDRRPAVIDSVGLIRRRRYDPQGSRRTQRRIIPKADNADTTRHS